MSETIVTLKKGEGRTLKAGGMWVFDNEIEKIAKLLIRFKFNCFADVHLIILLQIKNSFQTTL